VVAGSMVQRVTPAHSVDAEPSIKRGRQSHGVRFGMDPRALACLCLPHAGLPRKLFTFSLLLQFFSTAIFSSSFLFPTFSRLTADHTFGCLNSSDLGLTSLPILG
jgi:hypothetical protein